MTRRCDRIRLSASQSFTEAEVNALSELLVTVLAGRDARVIARSPVIVRLAQKTHRMRASVAKRRALREDLAAEFGQPDPQRKSPVGAECAAQRPPPAVPVPTGPFEEGGQRLTGRDPQWGYRGGRLV